MMPRKTRPAPAERSRVGLARNPKKRAEVTPRPEPTAKVAAALAAAREAHDARPIRAEIDGKLVGNALTVEPVHADWQGHSYQLCDTFGTTSNGFTSAALLQLGQLVTKDGAPNLDAFNASLALIGAAAPQNELEAALAVQMAATHDLSMEMIRRAKAASQLDHMREYGNLATKLNRTFVAQMKALSDHRRGGEQVVRHVHVYEGGQAVVAETVNVGGQRATIANPPHALIPAMLGQDTPGNGVPISGDPGQETVSDARRGLGGGAGE